MDDKSKAVVTVVTQDTAALKPTLFQASPGCMGWLHTPAPLTPAAAVQCQSVGQLGSLEQVARMILPRGAEVLNYSQQQYKEPERDLIDLALVQPPQQSYRCAPCGSVCTLRCWVCERPCTACAAEQWLKRPVLQVRVPVDRRGGQGARPAGGLRAQRAPVAGGRHCAHGAVASGASRHHTGRHLLPPGQARAMSEVVLQCCSD